MLSWVYLTADDQSTSSSWFRSPLWGSWLVLSLSFLWWQLLCCSSCRATSLTRGRVCNLQCNRWLVRSLRTNNHTLPSHLRLCSPFVASNDSQGLRWSYSSFYYIIYRNSVCTSQESHYVSATHPTRSLRTSNHTLPSHLRLCSPFVASNGSQGLRWRYSNPPPHGVTYIYMRERQYFQTWYQQIYLSKLITETFFIKSIHSDSPTWRNLI
jgi:hypothetical protein